MKNGRASEAEIFRVLYGLAISPTAKRTLAYCLFWTQYATHSESGQPAIWKTGPELEKHLSIGARTANRHLKLLAKLDMWTLRYRPRPGGIGKVTWLTLQPKGASIVELAQSVSSAKFNKSHKVTLGGGKTQHLEVVEGDHPMSQPVTSKQKDNPGKTASKPKSFLLSKEQAKAAKEALHITKSGKKTQAKVKAPAYVNAQPEVISFVEMVGQVWSAAGVQEWEWSSIFTWKHADEILQKFSKRGVTDPEALHAFAVGMIANWYWMRPCMNHGYASHKSNLHAPSPMAWAHEFEPLCEMLAAKLAPKKSKASSSSKFSNGFE